MIVCSTQQKEQEGDFFLNIYLHCDLYMCSIMRVGNPTERYEFIETEFEKDVNFKVPQWKQNWVLQIIKDHDIIQKNDSSSPFGKLKTMRTQFIKQ